MADDVFISYSRHDQEFVLKLATDLEDRGAHVWLDQGNIQGGEQWRQSIAAGVQSGKVFVLIVSPDSINSSYVAEELALASQYRKTIVPLIYRKTNLPAMLKAQLQNYQFLDFRHGGYAQNLADLITAITQQGVQLATDPAQLAQRRRERLGAPVKTQWGTVFGRIPGWAFAWGLGWAIFWLILLIFMRIAGNSGIKNDLSWPIGGFIGGAIGGLLAGLFTMLALRRNASSISWKHMSRAIRIWGIVGPLGSIISGALAYALFDASAIMNSGPKCSPMTAECFGQSLGYAFGAGLAAGIALVLTIIIYVIVTLFVIGLVSGWLAVRHIRHLEPGILGRQAIWVVLGWGGGAVLALLGSLGAMSALGG